MSGYKGHMDSKRSRDFLLTSSSLSFFSLSSSLASWDDDAIELNTKGNRTSCELQKGKHSKDSSQDTDISGLTHVTMEPPHRYDPERISASVFEKTEDSNWSAVSNESLFSLRTSNCQGFRMKPEEVLMPGEFLAYEPSLRIKPEDEEEKMFEVKETKSIVSTSVETEIHQEKSSSTPWSTNSGFDQLFQSPQPTKVHSLSLSTSKKKSKKTRKDKKIEKKSKCCIWSWLCLGISKCECKSCCFKWRNCCCCCCSK